MKKKGFTLVELLAVIAILAILVIVAMPNVLGMFNEAKVNTFVVDVQKIVDTSVTKFTSDSLTNGGKSMFYSSVENDILNTKKLDIDAPGKEYFIEMDRNGEFKRVIVFDDNYCYDVFSVGTITNTFGSNSKFFIDKINKSKVVVGDVKQSGNDSVVYDDSTGKVLGCESNKNVKGEIQRHKQFLMNGVTYQYEDGMTWEAWVNSSYNTIGARIDSKDYLRMGSGSGEKHIAKMSDGKIVSSFDYILQEEYYGMGLPG